MIKNLRISRNLTQTEVAKILGITQGTYQKYEKGQVEPTIQTLITLADFYGVTLDYLVGRPFAGDAGYLNQAESELLNIFRNATEKEQYKILGAVSALIKSKL